MAKQTFSVGQVLSAAQMTNLQQTALGGGAPVTKTASYTLVAADAGTVIQMNSASPTTITVNTSLFAAGDTVFIQNIGAGTCTVTAGTATVTTAGSLALTQWEGGTLYFTSTSASIFFDYIQAGVSIPLTTKGDLFGFDTANARVPIGSNGTVLTADSTQSLGLKWATPATSSSGLSLIKRASFSNVAGTSTTFDNVFTSTYKSYFVSIETVYGGTGADDLQCQLIYSGTTQTANYYTANFYANYTATAMSFMGENNSAQIPLTSHVGDSADGTAGQLYFNLVGNSSQRALVNGNFMNSNAISQQTMAAVAYTARTYTGFLLKSASSNITGTVAVYGLATA